MRWHYTYPSLGDTRVIKRFLVFPKTIQGETRWLEWALIDQVFSNYRGKGPLLTKRWLDRTWEPDPEPDAPEVRGGI